MTTFGLITEGPTDQIIISTILSGFFRNPDIDTRPLQPLLDETDKNSSKNFGGWTQVFEYCRSNSFKQAFSAIDYVVIHIDTDTCEEVGFGISKHCDGTELSPDELIEKVKEKLIEAISEDFYKDYSDKIIFAIAVHMTECWLLPLYYDNTKRAKTKNCIETLNMVLCKIGFTIAAKKWNYYDDASRPFLHKRTLMRVYSQNPSLKTFIEEIISRKIKI